MIDAKSPDVDTNGDDFCTAEPAPGVDPATLPDELLCGAFADSQVQRRAAFANECRLLAEIEQRRVWRHEGHASVYGWLRHHYGFSDAECRTRVTIARASLVLTDIIDTLSDGQIPIAHAEILSRAVNDCHHDPNVDRGRFERELGFWLNETRRDYHDFRTRIDEWSTRLRSDQALREEQLRYESRYCKIRRRHDNMVTVDALLDAEGGTHLIEALAQLAGQAFDHDWAAAQAVHGERTGPQHLTRTDQQRQADALTAMAKLAHTNPNSGFSHKPLVTILIDEHTHTDAMIQLGLYPTSARLPDDHITPSQQLCRTNTGVPIHPCIAAQTTLVANVRYTMVDKLMRPLATTSQQRLFTGALRDTVMATSATCAWPGCTRSINSCQADHYQEHHTGGPTNIGNGTPFCGRHNRYKTIHNYRPHQTNRGNWTLPPPKFTAPNRDVPANPNSTPAEMAEQNPWPSGLG